METHTEEREQERHLLPHALRLDGGWKLKYFTLREALHAANRGVARLSRRLQAAQGRIAGLEAELAHWKRRRG